MLLYQTRFKISIAFSINRRINKNGTESHTYMSKQQQGKKNA